MNLPFPYFPLPLCQNVLPPVAKAVAKILAKFSKNLTTTPCTQGSERHSLWRWAMLNYALHASVLCFFEKSGKKSGKNRSLFVLFYVEILGIELWRFDA